MTIRETRDIDMLFHIERPEVYLSSVTGALAQLGHRERDGGMSLTDDYTEHRWLRDVDGGQDQVDVLVAEHAAPKAYERQGRRSLPRMEGATQALQRTFNARLEIVPGRRTTVSLPDQLGALALKAAASRVDRHPERHLQDSVALLACLDDPIADRGRLKGSDHQRLHRLADMLGADLNGPHWATLEPADRREALDALHLLIS